MWSLQWKAVHRTTEPEYPDLEDERRRIGEVVKHDLTGRGFHSALRYSTPKELEHAIQAKKWHGTHASSGKLNTFTTTLTGAA
jgi:hypothetical protein